MKTRLELQAALEEILGSSNVYYQPPESVKMEYPAIIYSRENYADRKADDKRYKENTRYSITVISKKPDNDAITKLQDIAYCSYDQQFISDNLYHDVLTLYL